MESTSLSISLESGSASRWPKFKRINFVLRASLHYLQRVLMVRQHTFLVEMSHQPDAKQHFARTQSTVYTSNWFKLVQTGFV